MHKEAVTLGSTDDINIEQLVREATQSIVNAKQLLTNQLLSEKLSAEQLVRIAVSFETQCTAGFIILNQKVFYEKLSGNDLTRIGISHFNFSKLVVTRSELLEKLSSEQITTIGKRQNLAAIAIVKDASIYGRLSKEQILELAMRHSAAAKKVLKNPELTKYFTAEELIFLIEKYPDFSQQIPSYAVIKKKLNPSNVNHATDNEDFIASQGLASLGSTQFQSEESGVKSFFSKLSLSFSKLWRNEKDTEEEQSLLSNSIISPNSKKGM